MAETGSSSTSWLYAAARLLLVAVLSGVIYGVARLLGVTQFPVVVAVLFAFIIAMPLGIWLFSPLRRRAAASLALAGERRRRERGNCGPGCAASRSPARSGTTGAPL